MALIAEIHYDDLDEALEAVRAADTLHFKIVLESDEEPEPYEPPAVGASHPVWTLKVYEDPLPDG